MAFGQIASQYRRGFSERNKMDFLNFEINGKPLDILLGENFYVEDSEKVIFYVPLDLTKDFFMELFSTGRQVVFSVCHVNGQRNDIDAIVSGVTFIDSYQARIELFRVYG